MKAIGYRQSLPITDANALIDLDLPEPQAQGHDLLVEVKAISVNPVDVKIRANAAPAPGEAKVIGWDAAGVVKAVGPDVTLFQPGDEVWYAGDLTRPGTNSALHLVDERIAGHKPRTLDFAEAAALPLTAITAWELLFDRLQVPRNGSQPAHGDSDSRNHAGTASGAGPGTVSDTASGAKAGTATNSATATASGTTQAKSLLVIGAAGGVGSIMVQLARQLTDLTVIGTASRPETAAWVEQLGAHHVIDHSKPLNEEIARLRLPPVNYVAALNQTDHHWPAIVELVAPQGRVALIDDPSPIDVRQLKRKSVSLHWEFMFTRSMFKTDDIAAQHDLLEEVARLVDAGVIKTTLAERFGTINADNLKRAHALIESNRAKGKIVLEGF